MYSEDRPNVHPHFTAHTHRERQTDANIFTEYLADTYASQTLKTKGM